MTFMRSIIITVAVCLCIAFVYFLGYAIALKQARPVFIGAGLLLAGAAIIAATFRERVRS